MARPVEHANRRELLKLRIKPINSLIRWAWITGNLLAYRHYCECFEREYEAYAAGRGLYAA